ncbi:MAG: tyrosine-type recombinase/integrase [Desulfotomaculaceae bacterium]|nr:tyrosine-type recombinase/integrase [Desulfotomaculaceae bacterium]
MSPSVKALIEDFLSDLSNAGRSWHTIRNYRSDLNRFAGYYDGEIEDLKSDHLRQYLQTLAEKASSTRGRNFASLNKFLDWCSRFDIITANPLACLNGPKWGEWVPRAIPTEQLHILMQEIKRLPPRERLLFTMLLETGMRISEALGIQIENIDFTQGQEFVIIRGKGDRIRLVPLLPEMDCLGLLKDYIKDRNIVAGPLFRPHSGKKARPMSYRTALFHWEKLREKVGLKYEIHQLRHSCATSLLNDGVGIEIIRQLLGHQDIQTTSRYAKLDIRALRKELIAYVERRERGLVREEGAVWEICY